VVANKVRYEGREVTLQLPERADLEWAVHEAVTAFNLLKSRQKVRVLIGVGWWLARLSAPFLHKEPSYSSIISQCAWLAFRREQ